MEDSNRVFKILTGKRIGIFRHSCEDNIRMDLKQIGIVVMNCKDRGYQGFLANALSSDNYLLILESQSISLYVVVCSIDTSGPGMPYG